MGKKDCSNQHQNGNNKKKIKRSTSSNKHETEVTDTDTSVATTVGNNVDIDEEIPGSEWNQFLKGRFISRDSIIVSPVIAKFNHEDAISDNFKAFGRITRINMWDDESAHIMFDKQQFADALVDKIQDVAVRYEGQFGLMSAKYHFRRPCEEFMNPDRRCPMQCRKFHGPYYKLDFIPLDTYLDEEKREIWTKERKKHVCTIVKARYKKFRKKFMDGMPMPITDDSNKSNTKEKKLTHPNDGYYGYEYDEEEYVENHRPIVNNNNGYSNGYRQQQIYSQQ